MRTLALIALFASFGLLDAPAAHPAWPAATGAPQSAPVPQPILCGVNSSAHNNSEPILPATVSGTPCVTGPAAAGYTVESCSVWIASSSSGGGKIACAVYADSNGNPGALVCASGAAAVTSSTLTTMALSGCGSLVPRSQYWIVVNSNAAGVALGEGSPAVAGSPAAACSTPNTSRSAAAAFGAWPSDFPAATAGACAYELYVTLDAAQAAPSITVSTSAHFYSQTNISRLLAFPGCVDASGAPIANCAVAWQVCGNSTITAPAGSTASAPASVGAQSAAPVGASSTDQSTNSSPPPQACIDLSAGSNTLAVNLLRRIYSQTTTFPIGNFTVAFTVGLPPAP
jgi:hypothetical protein